MAKGGKREGAGRKKGSTTLKTQELAKQLLADGISPLEVMLKVMRDAYAAALDSKEAAEKAVKLKIACDAAKDAAPYVHPKLANVQVGNEDNEPFKQAITVRYID